MENIIKKYVNILKKEDIVNFAKKNNLLLDKEELEIIYNTIKNRYIDIYNDGLKVINEYKDKLKKNTYDKLIEVYENAKKYYK